MLGFNEVEAVYPVSCTLPQKDMRNFTDYNSKHAPLILVIQLRNMVTTG